MDLQTLIFIITLWSLAGFVLVNGIPRKYVDNMSELRAFMALFVCGPYVWFIGLALIMIHFTKKWKTKPRKNNA